MWWLLAALGGGGLALAGRYLWDRRAARRGDAEELEQIRKLADEDVTLLGAELRRLDTQVAGHQLDPDARSDYQVALDAYEAAQRADIVWTQPKVGTRTVPACAQDAARIRSGDEPEVRYVRYGSRVVPYWEAGAASAPYGMGYFAAGAGASYLAIASFQAQGGMPGGWGDTGGHDFGGFDAGGGFDGGGFDGGFDGGGGGDGGG